MHSFLRLIYMLIQLKPLIMSAYAIFAIWTLARWVRAIRSTSFTWRDRLGALGLLAGTFSGLLFACFYVFFWVEHRLLAHGSTLFIYYAVGSCAAVAGTILALIGRGWVRGSASIVSLVMLFQWLGMWDMSLGLDQVITIVTLVSLVSWGIISLATRYFTARSGSPSFIQSKE
jgi:hypothetical protein